MHRLRSTVVALLAASVTLSGGGVATASFDRPSAGLHIALGQFKQKGEKPFVGSWRLTSFEARTASGQVVYPFGTETDGVLTYTEQGRMSGTIWKEGRQPFAINDQQRGTPEENTAAVQTYISYLGRFAVDRDAGTVSHFLDQSVFPNWNGTTQTRFYRFTNRGDTLELTTPPVPFGGTTLVGALVWERMR